MYISADNLDDLIHKTFAKIIKIKRPILTSRGEILEITGAVLKIKKPRYRLSHSETRGLLFSCLGELFWYLSGSDNLKFITYYIPLYKDESADGITVEGAYGPRLFNKEGDIDQVENIIKLLSKKNSSKQAVIQLFDARDLKSEIKSLPCTCTLQFMIRDGALHMFTHMRSNDAYTGLPHDIFAFTMIQEIIANILNVKLGTYSHLVNSLHIYTKDLQKAKNYLEEGWQDVQAMPAMPKVNVLDSLSWIKNIEEQIRLGRSVSIDGEPFDDYWKDIARLLVIFSHFKKGRREDFRKIVNLRNKLTTQCYEKYIRKRGRHLTESPNQPSLPFDTNANSNTKI